MFCKPIRVCALAMFVCAPAFKRNKACVASMTCHAWPRQAAHHILITTHIAELGGTLLIGSAALATLLGHLDVSNAADHVLICLRDGLGRDIYLFIHPLLLFCCCFYVLRVARFGGSGPAVLRLACLVYVCV